MKEFTSIESLRHIRQTVSHWCERNAQPWPTLSFTGTVKLHGTNGGIHISETGELTAQGRTRVLRVTEDSYGFAVWVHTNADAIREAIQNHFPGQAVTVFGEWVGKGIQKKVGVSTLDRHFVAFSVHNGEEYLVLPATLHAVSVGFRNIKEIPTYSITINMGEPLEAQEKLAELTLAVEQECPWTKYMGGSGIGEGIVWVCDERPFDSDLWFKTKGLEHKRTDPKPRVDADPVLVESIAACVAQILPEWRLEQGISQLQQDGIAIEPRSTGEYLKWINKDILKEESDVLAANGLEWSVVGKSVQKVARDYFLAYIERN